MSQNIKKSLFKSKGFLVGFVAIVVVVISTIGFFVFNGVDSKNKTYDEQFMSSLEKGLENRWAETDKAEKKSEAYSRSKANYTKYINAELNQIEQYRNKQFKSSSLQENALAYINVLKEAKKSLSFYGSDDFADKWTNAYDKRASILSKINKIHKIKVSDNYKDYLAELLGAGKSVVESNKFNEKLDNLLKNVKFTAQPADFEGDDWITYDTTVKNTTGKDISSLSATVKLKDASGVVVDTQYLSADNWLKNESTKFNFMTDQKFNSTEIRVSFVDAK